VRLNFPVLDLQTVEEELAFGAVESILANDPTLKAVTKLFLSWKGDVEDIWKPSVATCPYLRITPMGGSAAWETEQQHKMPLKIEITAAVIGSNRKNLLNYWGAVRRALFPQNSVNQLNSVLAIIAAASAKGAMISRGIISDQNFGVVVHTKNDGDRICWTQATLTVVMLVATP
jgi:hypothetical protein